MASFIWPLLLVAAGTGFGFEIVEISQSPLIVERSSPFQLSCSSDFAWNFCYWNNTETLKHFATPKDAVTTATKSEGITFVLDEFGCGLQFETA